MPLKHIKLEVFQGKGNDKQSLGLVDGIELTAQTAPTLIDEIKELIEEKSIEHIVSALNYGLAVKARSSKHRPENKVDVLKKSVTLTLSKEKSALEISKIVGLPIAEIERIIAEGK